MSPSSAHVANFDNSPGGAVINDVSVTRRRVGPVQC